MYKLFYPLFWLLKKSKSLSALSCRLTKLTGKSKYPIHPKHLIKIEKPWYLESISKTDTVLDLGCGNGQHSLKVTKKCKKIIGVDQDNFQLEIAHKSAEDKNIKNIKFLKYSLEKKLPFKNNSFDEVLCLDVLEHLVRRRQILLEIKRILKPEGVVFISIPNKNTSWKNLQKKIGLNPYVDPDHKTEYDLDEVKKIFPNVGFKILSIEPIVYDNPFDGFIDLMGGFSLELYKRLSLWKKNKVKNNLQESSGFRIKLSKESKWKIKH